jgi:hypothetical protein
MRGRGAEGTAEIPREVRLIGEAGAVGGRPHTYQLNQ